MSEPNSSPGRSGRNRAWPLFVGLPVIVALAVAAVILIGGGGGQGSQGAAENDPSSGETSGQSPRPGETSAAERSQEEQASSDSEEMLGTPALGDEGAPVVMTEYSDYQ